MGTFRWTPTRSNAQQQQQNIPSPIVSFPSSSLSFLPSFPSRFVSLPSFRPPLPSLSLSHIFFTISQFFVTKNSQSFFFFPFSSRFLSLSRSRFGSSALFLLRVVFALLPSGFAFPIRSSQLHIHTQKLSPSALRAAQDLLGYP